MRTILLVEDDAAVQRGLKENLERENFRVIVERDGVRGLSRARRDRPDLLILDVMLPGLNGFDICESLKREGYDGSIFMLTALAEDHLKLRGLGMGADEFLRKPFSLQELLLRVKNSFDRTDRALGKAKELEKELQRAREIQREALPKRAPRVEGISFCGTMTPATQVGGDYFDYLTMGPSVVVLVVADVSGKGMPAALYVHKMQGIVHASQKLLGGAADVLLGLQHHLGLSMDVSSFVTCVAARFDLNNKIVEIAGAGHPPVFLKRGSHLREIPSEGMIIGQAVGGQFDKALKTTVVELRRGDLLCFYTDGVTEAMNRAREEFGVVRLKRALMMPDETAKATVSRCLHAVRNFTGGEPQSDDITMVVARIS